MSDPRKDLPPVTAPNFLEKVRESLQTYLGNRGNALDQGLTRRDLQDLGLVDKLVSSRVGSILPGALAGALDGLGGGTGTGDGELYEPDLTPPPTPTGFTATAAIINLLLSCDSPSYIQGHGHAKSRLYGAKHSTGPLPVFTNAVMLTEFSGTVYSYATDPATTWHLWLTWVTVDGVESVVPAGGTNGVEVTTGQDVALLLEALTGEITESELYADLNTRINKIDVGAGSIETLLKDARTRLGVVDTPVTGTVALAQSAADEALAALVPLQAQIADIAGSPDYDNATSYLTGQFVKYDSKLYQALTDTTGNLPTDPVYWKLIGEYASLGDAVAAMNVSLSDHTTRLGVVEGVATASQQDTEILASRLDWDEALIDINRLGGGVLTGTAKVASEAGIFTVKETIATEVEARATQTLDLYAKFADNVAGLVVEQETRATRDTATSSQVTTLVADVGGNKSSLKVAQTAAADASSAVASQIATLTATVKDSASSLVVEQKARADANSASSSQLTTLAAETGANRASLTEEKIASTTRTSAVASQVVTLAAATGDAAASLKLEQIARTDESEVVASQVLRLHADFGDNKAGLMSEQTVRADAVSATARKLDLLTAKTGESDAAIVSEKLVRTTDSSALASQISGLTATTGSHTASINTLNYAITDPNGALATQSTTLKAYSDARVVTFAQASAPTAKAVGDLWMDTDDSNKLYRWSGSAWVTVRDATIAAVDARVTNLDQTQIGYATLNGYLFDNNGSITNKATMDAWNAANGGTDAVWVPGLPLAKAVKQVSVTDADGNTAALEQAFTAQKTLNDGLKLQYTVKIDTGGAVMGYGLASTLVNGVPKSAFGVRADQFWLAAPVKYTQSTTPTATSWGTTAIYTLCKGKALLAAGDSGGTILGSSSGTWVRPQDTQTPAKDASGNPTGSMTAAAHLSGTTFSTSIVYGSAYGDGVYVVVGASGKVATSRDGQNWVYRATLSATTWGTTTARGITYAEGKFFVVGDAGRFAVGVYTPGATDAASTLAWTYYGTLATAFASSDALGIRSQYGALLAFGAGGKFAHSEDNGATWTKETALPTAMSSYAVRSMAFGAGIVLAVGDNGKVATSQDGVTWTARAGLAATAWSTAAAYVALWDGEQFLVAGEFGNVATSPNGITWTHRPGLYATAWTSSTAWTGVFVDGKFTLAGASGKLATSPDGVTWTYSTALSKASAMYEGAVWVDTTTPAAPVTKYYVDGAWTTTSPRLPFVVQATPDIIDGVPVPAGIYAESAYFMNGTIGNAQIGFAAIDDAKVANLSASKLTAGTIDVGQYIQSSGYVPGSAGWRINGNGIAEFSGVVVRGTIFASAGTIGGSTIGSNYMRSTSYALGMTGWNLNSDGTGQIGGFVVASDHIRSYNYVAGSAGWKLGKDGFFEASSGTFRGALAAATGTFAGSLSAATGTFAGALSAATGTFSGTLTANAVNAVSTINIAGEAVTVPRFGSNVPFQHIDLATPVAITLPSVYVPTGAVVIQLSVTGYGTTDGASSGVPVFKIQRNGTTIWSKGHEGVLAVAISDTPGGDAVYRLVCDYTWVNPSAFSDATLLVLGCKK